MKRIALLFIAAMLVASPVFAATTVYRGNQGKAGQSTMQGNINDTKVENSQMVNVGQDNTIKVGGMSNTGGYMAGNIQETEIKNSQIVNVGKGNTVEVGTMTNQ